jgi:hypothetical protein
MPNRLASPVSQTEPANTGPWGGAAQSPDKLEPIGPKPPEDVNELLARTTTLLLKPGKVQTEVGFLYSRLEAPTITVLPGGAPVLERIRNRVFIAPFSLRYGFSERIELFTAIPLGMSLFERDNVLLESHEEAGVLGDITAGFVCQGPETWFHLPDTAFSFNVTTPTSSSSVATLSTDEATLGYGVWKLGVGFNFVESVDPIVFYGGLGYEYQFAETKGGLRIQRGDAFNCYFGAGFAVSDDISLSTQISWFLQDKSSISGVSIPNSDIEPMSVRLGFIRRLSLKSRIQPSIEFGLTPDAADATVSLRFIHDE